MTSISNYIRVSWVRCYSPCSEGHTRKVAPGTQNPYLGAGTQDPGPSTWDPGPRSHSQDPGLGTFMWDPGSGTLHLWPFTWNPGPIARNQDHGPLCWTRDLGPFTWDPGPYMWDAIQGTNTWDQSKKTHFVYQGTVFCNALTLIYSLEFSSQFLIIAKWFQITFSVLNNLILIIFKYVQKKPKSLLCFRLHNLFFCHVIQISAATCLKQLGYATKLHIKRKLY